MSDFIKREDALLECEALIPIDCKMMKKRINDIPSAENKGEWIPCSEKLPSKGVPVLVNGIMEDAPPITISNDAPLYYEKGWINAWMPLPEPWKGADDD